MKPRAIPSICLAFLLTIGISANLHAAADDHAWIRVEGNRLMTSATAQPANSEFVPVGVMLDGAAYSNQKLNDFVRYCKAHHFNTVRYGFNTNNYGEDWDFDAEIAEILVWLEIARENQLYTIFDNHGYFGHSSVTFWNETEYERWRANYAQLADTVKNNPWVLGFELMNEVFKVTLTESELKSLLQSGAARIRAVNTKHLIIVPDTRLWNETYYWNNTFNPADFDTLNPPQVVLSPHMYSNYNEGEWKQLSDFDEMRTERNAPAIFTEFNGGNMGNGFTYERNKTWLREMMTALDTYDFGWIIFYYRPSYSPGNFATMYAPDDPTIWGPVAQSMFDEFPVPSNGTPDKITVDLFDDWFVGMSSNDNAVLTVRVVDSTGCMVSSSDAAISVSVSGPASVKSAPSTVTNGKALVTLEPTGGAGTVVATVTSSGLTEGSLSIPCVENWTNATVQNRNTTDNTFECTVDIQDVAKGVNTASVRYEYSTDDGSSWTYWDSTESDEFSASSLNTSKWTSVDHNTEGGSATVAGGELTIRGEGEDVWSSWQLTWDIKPTFAKDEFHYVYEERTGDFEVITKVTSQTNTDPFAFAGIFVRDSVKASRYNGPAYVAVTPEHGYMFGWKDLGHMGNAGDKENFKYIDAAKTAGTTTYPCWLKLTKVRHPAFYEGDDTGYNRQHHIYTGYYSTDGTTWHQIYSKIVHQSSSTQKVGLFVCSGVDGTLGEATFDFYRVAQYASCTGDRYSTDAETITTEPIPFVQDATTLVRFKALSQVPYHDYINNPGHEFVGEYSVVNGQTITKTGSYVGISSKTAPIAPNTAVSVFPNPHRFGLGKPLTFAINGSTDGILGVYTLSGKLLQQYKVKSGKRAVHWDGLNSAGQRVTKGMYLYHFRDKSGRTKVSGQIAVMD